MEEVTNNILVPIDFTEQSFIGLEQAIVLAIPSKAEVTLLHVIKESGVIWNLFSDEEKSDVIKKVEAKMRNFANLLDIKHQVKITTIVERGYIIDKIIEVENRLKVNFIVMGTTSADNIMKKIIGSNALRVVHEAQCPVLTIKGRHFRNECNNIILPLDLHKNTKEKVDDAINIAKIFKAKIYAVSVISFDDENIHNKFQSMLNQVKLHIEKNNIECSSDLLKTNNCGSKKDCIEKYITEKSGDLIVITTQEQNLFIDYFIGSFAKEMIHDLDIPVMSIVPKLKRRAIFHPY